MTEKYPITFYAMSRRFTLIDETSIECHIPCIDLSKKEGDITICNARGYRREYPAKRKSTVKLLMLDSV